MAETANLGKLVVQMLLDPTKWQEGVSKVQASAQALVSGITQVAQTINSSVNPAMDEMGESADDAGEAVSRLAGVYMDANGKLRDASGKFVKDADVLKGLGDAAGLTEDQLRILQTRAEQIQFESASKSAKSFINGLKNLTDFLTGAVVTAFKAASVAGGALITASAVVGVSFESQMKKVATIAGAGATELQLLTDEARRLGATTAYSATEAAQAMEVLASAGMDSAEIIAATGQAMVLAGAGGTSLESAASIVASTLAQFNLSAVQAGRVADVFAQATADSQFQVDDLGEALKYGGPAAAAFGLSLEQTVAIMAQFRNLGLEGSMAGTALRSALSQASQQTKINADTLAKYNLTLSDVNPRLHSFGEILATVGGRGMSAADAMVVFGVEAGGAVATLAEQTALGSTKLDEMTASLQRVAVEGGAATAMYEQMQATVAGALAELQSAGEEVLLTLYAQYGGDLAGLLARITEFVNEVAVAIADRSAEIRSSLGQAMSVIGDYLTESGGDFAKMFADGVVAAAEFAISLAQVATYLADLIPLLDDIALAMGVIWVAQKVAAMVSVVSELVTVFGSARVALKAFMVEMTAASGGTYALVAAIGVLVVGLGTLIARYVSAKDAAEQLKEAQDALNSKRTAEDQARVDQLDAILQRQQAGIAAESEALAASGKLTAAKKAELDVLSSLTAESAARLEADGKLVEVGGQLRTVAALVEEANTSGADAASSGYAAINQRVAQLKATASEAGKDYDALSEAITRARAAAEDGGNDTVVSSILSYAIREDIKTIAEAEARLEDLKSRRRDAASQATALETERGKAVAKVLDQEVSDTRDAEASKLRSKGDAASQAMRTEQKYTDETRDIRWKLSQELAGMEGALTDTIGVEMADRRREVRQAYADQIEKAKGNATEIARLEADLQGALTDLDEIEARKRAAKRMEIEQAHAKEVQDERKKLLDKLTDLQDMANTEVERLEREKAETLAGISGANADLSIKIAEEYNRKIAAAREEEVLDAKQAAQDRLDAEREAAKQTAAAVVSAFKSATSAVASTMSGVYDLLSGLFDKVVSLFEAMTGFSFDLMSIVSDAQSAQASAAEEGTTLTSAEAAQQVMQTLFSDALAFVTMLAEVAPTILKDLAAGLPDLIDAFLGALPDVLAAILDAAPTIVGLILDALPAFLDVVRAALPDLVDVLLSAVGAALAFILDQLPSVLTSLVDAAGDLIAGVIARLPDVIGALLNMLPDLITKILGELPRLIRALVNSVGDIIVALAAALPDLVSAILGALPDILTALIYGLVEALPDVVEALVEAIPELILAIVAALPQIISAVANALPYLITALIGLIPTLINGIADALPVLLPALVSLAGDLVAAIVAALPDIAASLIISIVDLLTDLPELATAFGNALVEGIKGAAEAIFDALADIFTSLWESIADFFGGGSDRNARTATTSAVPPIDLSGVVVRVPQVEATRATREEPARRPAPGTTGQGSTARVQVVLNGRTVQDVLATSDARGETTLTRQRASGSTKVGMDRGRYNRFAK